MLEWYSDKNLGILFDDIPKIGIRYFLPTSNDDDKKSIKKYPFINRQNLKVELRDYKKRDIVMTGHQCPVFFGGL